MPVVEETAFVVYTGESPAGLFGDPGPRYRDEVVDRMAKARGWSIRPVSRPLRPRSWSVGLSRLSGSRRVWSSLLSLSLRRPRREGCGLVYYYGQGAGTSCLLTEGGERERKTRRGHTGGMVSRLSWYRGLKSWGMSHNGQNKLEVAHHDRWMSINRGWTNVFINSLLASLRGRNCL